MANSFKASLNLPETAFPMRANLANREEDAVTQWDADRVYYEMVSRRAEQGAPKFILHDGPPYANGNIHHGHILNKVLKDFIVKYRALAGFEAPYNPGWDCHGLPIEHQVDKNLGKKKRDMTKVQIRQACREYADDFVSRQSDEFRRMLVFADWSAPYRTMDYSYEAKTVRELGRIYDRGLAYRGLKPVHWDWAAQTALAEAEVEYDSFVTEHVYVKFPFTQLPAELAAHTSPDDEVFVVIWTTTPWTLPANLAVALNPDLDYQLVRHEGEVYVLADGLRESTLKACRIDADAVEILTTFEGRDLVGELGESKGLAARHPWIDRESVLLPADYVTLEQGTGCVHTAPGHGQEDFHLGTHHGLVAKYDERTLCPVNRYGKFYDLPETQKYVNVQVHKANPQIQKDLAEMGALLNSVGDKVTIDRYPHGWRSKKPVIFRATTQWFVAMEPESSGNEDAEYRLRERALEVIEDVEWVPHWGKDRITGMVEQRPDWCISRQRSWGVPIVALHCEGCGHVLATSEVTDHVADMVESEGVDVWFAREAEDLVPEHLRACGECGATDSWRKEEDILDVWFDSGVSWSAVLETQLGLGDQADLYLEGSDQHRGWFQSSLMCSLLSRDKSPYKTCLTHGFVVDEDGRKYSKSSKNFEPPSKMLSKHGAEVMRLWVAAVDYRGDITLSHEIMDRVADSYRKIRNTVRFMLGNLDGFDPATDLLPLDELEPLDRWALHRTGQAIARIEQAYGEYQFHTIYHTLVSLMTVDMSNVFMDIAKDRMYCSEPDSARRRSGQTAFWLAVDALLRACAPILSFTTQEAWESMPRLAGDPKYVFWSDFPTEAKSWVGLVEDARWADLLTLRGEVQKALEAKRGPRKNKRPDQIGSSQEADVVITAMGADLELLRAFESDLVEILIVASVELVEGQPTSGGALDVAVTPSTNQKCPRCWNQWVAPSSPEGTCCERCAAVLKAIDFTVE